jgi:glycosyltransferase involved in cell wall biosynthesis
MAEFAGPVVLLDPGNFSPQYTANLCSSLAQLDVDVTLITSPPQFGGMPSPCGYRVESYFFRGISGPGVLRQATAHSPRSRMVLKACAYPFGLARTKRLLGSAKSPGILHYQWAHLPILDAGLVSRLRAAGWRTVATAHEFAVPAPFMKRHALRFYRSVDAVVVHTARLAERARAELRIQAPRLNVIARGDLGALRGPELSRQEARARIAIGGCGPVLLFFGMIKPNKGLIHLLRAMPEVLRKIPDARLVIAGEPVENFDNYAATIGQLGIEHAVITRLGYVRDEDAGAYFQSADVIVLPHIEGSLSGVAWAALGFGRPLLGTNVGGLPDLVEEGMNGVLVAPGSSTALSQAIIRMLGDREQLERMGERGRAAFEERYSWARTANQTLQLYRRLMSGPPVDAGPLV